MDENRIVLIRGDNSQWYEQAIFILKSPVALKSRNLVAEAEKIITDYMTSGRSGVLPPKLEQYKKTVYERTMANKSGRATLRPDAASAAVPIYPADAANQKVGTKKYDFVTLFIGASLVISSVLFGFIIHGIMSQ